VKSFIEQIYKLLSGCLIWFWVEKGVSTMQIWSRRAILLGSVGWLVAACSHGQAGKTLYSVGVSGEGNQLTITQDSSGGEDTYIATVQSERGIGQASIAWWGNTSPHPLRFRLQLAGLEQFSLRWAAPSGQILVNIGVNSMDQQVFQSVQIGREAESEIAADSPYWLDVTLPNQKGAAYELTTPLAFQAYGPRLFTIAWVDFYR
jgi:hypothetical protein